jgi:hypothetical protein
LQASTSFWMALQLINKLISILPFFGTLGY